MGGRQELLDCWPHLCYHSAGGQGMHEHIEVVYENGALRPLGPLPPELREHQHLTVTIDTPGAPDDRLDAACLAAARRDADPSVSLEEVRRILARVPGTLAQAAIAEREER
jgi:predicted DNA-binding antitoxin AbrB/MazE fold protein